MKKFIKKIMNSKLNFTVILSSVVIAMIFNSCSSNSEPNGNMVLKINDKVGAMAVTCIGINVMGEGLPNWDEYKDQVKTSPNAGGGVNKTATWNGTSSSEMNFSDLAIGDKIVQVYTNNSTSDCEMSASTGKLVELGRGSVSIIGGKENIAEITITTVDPATITTDIRDWNSSGTIPAAPSSFVATATSDANINLTWSDNSTDELSFKIERSLDNSTWSLIHTTAANATSYSNSGLSPATLYYYRIYSSNATGDSAMVTDSETTQNPPPPSPPSGLAVTPRSESKLNLNWTDNSSDETFFEIHRSLDNITFSAVASSTVNAAAYSDTGLSPSTVYYYKVLATNGGGNSAFTSVVSATTTNGDPIAPSNLVGVPMFTSADLTWEDNSDEETGYEIERSDNNNSSFSLLATVSASVTVYQDFSVSAATMYYYRVRSIRTSHTSSAYSNEFLVVMP